MKSCFTHCVYCPVQLSWLDSTSTRLCRVPRSFTLLICTRRKKRLKVWTTNRPFEKVLNPCIVIIFYNNDLNLPNYSLLARIWFKNFTEYTLKNEKFIRSDKKTQESIYWLINLWNWWRVIYIYIFINPSEILVFVIKIKWTSCSVYWKGAPRFTHVQYIGLDIFFRNGQ